MDINSLIEQYGLWTAFVLAVLYGLYKLFERVFPEAFARWQHYKQDDLDYRQSMGERMHDLRAQLLTIRAGQEAETHHKAFEIIDRLLDEKQRQVSEIQDALIKITTILAEMQQDTKASNRRYEERLKNIGENLRQVWGMMGELREGLKSDR